MWRPVPHQVKRVHVARRSEGNRLLVAWWLTFSSGILRVPRSMVASKGNLIGTAQAQERKREEKEDFELDGCHPHLQLIADCHDHDTYAHNLNASQPLPALVVTSPSP